MVNTRVQIDIANCVGTDALLGRRMGDSHFPLLLGAILKADPGRVAYLDFTGITNITASYIAATIVRLLRMIAGASLDRYIIIGGISQDYQDEVAYVLEHENTPVLLHTSTDEIRVLGPLDYVYAQTLNAVVARGRVTAKELRTAAEETIGQTGWIKRLTTLYTLGLLVRRKNGREYAYEPITMET